MVRYIQSNARLEKRSASCAQASYGRFVLPSEGTIYRSILCIFINSLSFLKRSVVLTVSISTALTTLVVEKLLLVLNRTRRVGAEGKGCRKCRVQKVLNGIDRESSRRKWCHINGKARACPGCSDIKPRCALPVSTTKPSLTASQTQTNVASQKGMYAAIALEGRTDLVTLTVGSFGRKMDLDDLLAADSLGIHKLLLAFLTQ